MDSILEPSNGVEKCIKRSKPSLNFWSPLNDSFGLPDKKSSCTWHQNVDKSTNPHETENWYDFIQ